MTLGWVVKEGISEAVTNLSGSLNEQSQLCKDGGRALQAGARLVQRLKGETKLAWLEKQEKTSMAGEPWVTGRRVATSQRQRGSRQCFIRQCKRFGVCLFFFRCSWKAQVEGKSMIRFLFKTAWAVLWKMNCRGQGWKDTGWNLSTGKCTVRSRLRWHTKLQT